MLAIGSSSLRGQVGCTRPGSLRISPSAGSGGRLATPKSRRSLRKQGPGTSGDATLQAAPDSRDLDNDERSAVLAKRAAAIACKLLQQQQGNVATSPKSPPDESLTILLTSLLRSLADATTTATNSSSSSSFPAATQAPQIPGHQCTPLTASDASDRLVQLLTQWADEFLLSDPTPVTSTQKVPGSTPAEPATLAKQLFMQLLAELLPPVGTSGPTAATTGTARRAPKGPQQQQQQPNLGRGLLAATAAAFTAREVVSRLQQHSEAEGSSAGSSRSHAPGVKHSAGSATGSFESDAWEADAKPAAEAADMDDTCTPAITPDMAAAAVATNTHDFSPDAWNLAAAAAAAAAASEEDEQSPPPDRSHPRLPLPKPCWAVSTLSEALQAATAAATLYRQSGSTGSTVGTIPCVQELLLLPASQAVQLLLQLSAVHRAGLLLLLCGAEGQGPAESASVSAAGEGRGVRSAGFGCRGADWLVLVLEGVAPGLGLVEMGVLLAATHNRYGNAVFLRACATLLPLTDTTDAPLTLAHPCAPPPASALQALLLHWLLTPQLAAAGLPLLPEPLLLQLLPQIASSCNLSQLGEAAKWGSLWPLAVLQPAAATAAPSSSSSSSSDGGRSGKRWSKSDWQVMEPQIEAAVASEAWCGFTGISMPWLAHVAAAAAAKITYGTSSSSSSGQLSQGAAAAANDARAVLTALIRGLEPSEPLLLLLMQAVQLLQPGLVGVAASSTADSIWRQQLQQLLLEAYSGTGLPVITFADVIHRSLCCMLKAGTSVTAASLAPTVQQQQVLTAAAAVLASFPPQKLQQELQILLYLHQEASTGQPGQAHSCQATLGSMLAATAAAADADQAAAMLAVLPMPFWADTWATFVSPAAGCFCWSRQQLVAHLQAVSPASSSSSSCWDQVKAAWEVVAAHFNLQAVVQEVATRPKVTAATTTGDATTSSSSSSSSSSGDGIKPFSSSKPYSYQPGAPFVGDGWDQAEGHTTPIKACFEGSLGPLVVEVLSAAPLPVAATHIAALAGALPVQAFARVAAVVVPCLVSALDNVGPASSSSSSSGEGGLTSLAKGLLKLYGRFPELPEAPHAMQLLAAAAPSLSVDRLPLLLTSAADISAQLKQMRWVPGAQAMSNHYSSNYEGSVISDESSPELSSVQQLELVVAASASGRDSVCLQHMLAILVRHLPLREAHVAFRVLQGLNGNGGIPYQPLPYAAVEEASSILRRRCDDVAASAAAGGGGGGGDGWAGSAMGLQQPQQQQDEVVWQLGQSAAAAFTPAAARQALGSYVQGWDSPWTAATAGSSGSSGGSSGSSTAADREMIRKLVEVVAEIPAAPPAGSWPMDAMHSPSYTAPLLKRCLALLVDWTPSCPAAAALVAQQVNSLAHKRAWTAAEASAFLQRLPLGTALQLLLETDTSSSSSSSSNKGGLLARSRPKLLRALVDWQGSEAVVQGLRELLVGYVSQGLVSFIEVLTDLRLALSGPSAAAAAAAGAVAVVAPNAYVAAVVSVLEVLLPTTSSSSSGVWSQKLAQVLAQVSADVPEAATARLAENIGRSLTDSHQKPTSVAAAAATTACQADVAALLTALPAAAAAAQGWDWVPFATAVATAVAESAGSTAVLSCIRLTMQTAAAVAAAAPSGPSALSAWVAELATVLGRLQQQGVLTCGVAYGLHTHGVSTAGSSSMGARFSSKPGPLAPSCISLQLLQLLQNLYHTDRVVTLQQAAAAVLSVKEGLGKALPMAVAAVLGGGSLRTARGYQALYGGVGTDCPDAAAALEAATADSAGKFQPTAAALPAATAAAARELSEVLARCHELLPDPVMASLMAALAAVIPWTDTGSSSGSGSSSSGSGVTCPAEVEMRQGGWSGVTQVLLITSSLLTASCRVWGVDKGTQVAASLIEKLTTTAAAAADGAAAAAVVEGGSRGLPRSRSASELQGASASAAADRGAGVGSTRALYKRSVSAGSITWEAFSSSNSSSSHAARAEAALSRASAGVQAEGQGSASQGEGAAARLRAAAGTGGAGTAQPGSQADRAKNALLRVASSSSSSSSGVNSQAGVAAASLRAAAATGGVAGLGSHANKAAAALLAASDSSSNSSSRGGLCSHSSRAESKLLHAAGATGGEAVPASHAARANAALLQAAGLLKATGLSTPASPDSSGCGAGASARGSGSHAQHAQHALLQALASSSNTASSSAAADRHAELAVWGTAQLLSAADAWYWPGLTAAKGLVRGILYPRYYSAGPAAAAVAGGMTSGSQFDVLAPAEVAAALAAALPRLAIDLPANLTAEVLAQIWGLTPAATWARCLNAVSASVAAAPAAVTGTAAGTVQVVGGSGVGVQQLLQLLAATAISLHQQLEPSRELPAAYATLLSAAASKLPEGGLQLLLQQMLGGTELVGKLGRDVGYAGVSRLGTGEPQGLTSEGFAQLLLELSHPGAAATTTSSSNSSTAAAAEQQLMLVASAASAIFAPHSSSSSSSSNTAVAAADMAAAMSGRLYQAELLPRTYLTLLLQPYLSTAQRDVCVKQLGLTSGAPETSAAVTALSNLCNTLSPGRRVPLATYAQVLATALDVVTVQDFSRVGFQEARAGLEFERQQTLQQLLASVVTVFGTFRGMRQLYSSPLGAQMVLPMHDLAAVLCYSWQLLPVGAATALAEAVAAALGELSAQQQQQQQLMMVLQLLPNAAAEGFGKESELWRPLLHVMAVAGGLSESQESSLAHTLMSVTAKQQKEQVSSHPLGLESSSSSSGGGSGNGRGGFADPAAVTAALAGAAAVNDVGLSAGRVSRGTAAGGQAAATEAAAAAAGKAEAGDKQQQQQQGEEEQEELTPADAALLTTAGAAYLCAALTGFTPLAVFMGGISTLLVAALGAIDTANTTNTNTSSSSSKADDASSCSSSSSSQAGSAPVTPRTPTTSDTGSRRRHAAMGGRTKVTIAQTSAATAVDGVDAAAVLGYGAAAAAAAGGGDGGEWALGSLAVDPDDVIKKIKGQSAQLPLDEALMELVPLLLLPADGSSHTWPLLGLSAVLHSKFPRLHTLLGPGGASLTNMALAATLVNPDGPLAAVMNASELLAQSDPSSSSRDVVGRELLASLVAAEAVHPHAVAMQLAERLLNALWAVLTGSVSGTASGTAGAAGAAAGTGGTVSTPEGAAALWQEIAVHLLSGAEPAAKLLSGFAHRQQGNWEAQLRALAVAAALQGHTTTTSSSSSGGSSGGGRGGVLSELLVTVCGSNNYPPLSFLSLLLHHADVALGSADTATVLDAAAEQIIANYSTRLPAAVNNSSSSGGGGGRNGWNGFAVAGDFDSWGFDALADGPQYRATSGFSSSSSSSSSGAGVKVSPVPASVLILVESLVSGACARGHAAQALLFLAQLLGVANTPARFKGGSGVAGAVVVMDQQQEQQLLQMAVGAVDCSLGKGPADAAAAAAGGGCSANAAAAAAGAVLELVGVLGDRDHLSCINAVVAAACRDLAQQYSTTSARTTPTSSGSSSWASAEVVGQVLSSAAQGVRKSEGVLSAAKPAGALFLATAADGLFGAGSGVPVEGCLVLLSAVAVHMPERLGLQVVAAAAGRLHSVMPQAVGLVRQVATS